MAITSPVYFAAGAELDEERERLRLLEGSRDQATIRHLETLGVAAGWRCLEVGAGGGSIAGWLADRVGASGHVVATDIDTRLVREIRRPNLEVREHDIDRDELETGAYDLVHCRAVLMHVGDFERAASKMVSAIRRGGVLLVEEGDFSTFSAVDPGHPRSPRFTAVNEAAIDYMETALGWGRSRLLPVVIDALGLTDIRAEITGRIDRGASTTAEVYRQTFDRLASRLLATGTLSPSDLEAHSTALVDPTFYFRSAAVVSVSGRRPRVDVRLSR